MKPRIAFILIMLFSIDALAKMGDSSSSSEISPAIRDRLEPSSLYFPVIIPIFILSLVLLYFLCKMYCISQNPKKHLILPALSGFVLFILFPHIYAKFFRIYVELGIDSNFPRIDFPYLASGKVLYGILLIVIWLSFQPVVLQVFLKRREKPLLYPPFIIIFIGYAIWHIWTLFAPLMVIIH